MNANRKLVIKFLENRKAEAEKEKAAKASE